MDPLATQGRKDAAAAPFMLDAAAARKQAGQAALAATKTTGVGAMGKAAAVALQRHAMEAGTGEGRQRTGTALGLKLNAAAAAVAPFKVAPRSRRRVLLQRCFFHLLEPRLHRRSKLHGRTCSVFTDNSSMDAESGIGSGSMGQ